MKFETLMLCTLFVVCSLLGGLILAAMLGAAPPALRLAAHGMATSSLTLTPTTCGLPPGGVVCRRLHG